MSEQQKLWRFDFVVECDDKLTVEALFERIVLACEEFGAYMGGGFDRLEVEQEVEDGTAQDGDEV